VLDYGCGDGTFLALLSAGDRPPALAVGAELHARDVDDCRARFAHEPLRFTTIAELADTAHAEAFDTLFCMEVLEHVIEPDAVLCAMRRLLVPGGTLVLSVPIETGLPVIAKQMVRRVAGWRGIGHYPGTTAYSLPEIWRSVFAGATQHIARPIFRGEDGTEFHDHKGFNWRLLRSRVRAHFDLQLETTSPVPWLGSQLGTQRWLVARRRAS
jgi:SAM-dependent methyltransferase